MTPVETTLTAWLQRQEPNIARFHTPLSLDVVAAEAGIDASEMGQALRTRLVHHLWAHTHRGQSRPCKPFCLRENGPGTVGIDQEDSVIGACEGAFLRRGYQTVREVGTDADLDALVAEPDLSQLSAGVNQRDLLALRRSGKRVELWVVEAKGKEAAEFDHYTVAEALGQLFPVPADPLSTLIGGPRGAGHGRCAEIAATLYTAWSARGYDVTITLGLLLPYSAPDVVWKSGRAVRIATPLYQRPVDAILTFIDTGSSGRNGRFKYQQAFGTVLEHLDAHYALRHIARAGRGLRFRLLLAGADVIGLD